MDPFHRYIARRDEYVLDELNRIYRLLSHDPHDDVTVAIEQLIDKFENGFNLRETGS